MGKVISENIRNIAIVGHSGAGKTSLAEAILFNGKRKTPRIIEKLGKVLPCAIMGMLVVYCLKDMSFLSVEGYLPQIIACLIVVLLHVWKRNTLISIISGTVTYMILVQLVF